MSITAEQLEHTMRQAGDLALRHFDNLHHLHVSQKSPRDFVTAADFAVEAFLKQRLGELCPGYGFWGEEGGQSADQSSRWIVDPIDGTHSFAKGQYFWSISVALELGGQLVAGAVFAPALGDYYCAELGGGAYRNGKPIAVSCESSLDNAMVATGFACLRQGVADNNLARFARIAQRTAGQRRFGSAALDLCLVADGQVDAFWEQCLHLYDVAAGALIVMAAGGTVTDFDGRPGVFPERILVTNGKLLAPLLPLM